jgi:hypothetical protein
VRRIVMLVVVALVMVAMVLAIVGPAMADQPVSLDCPKGFRPQVIFVGVDPVKLNWECVPIGQPS